MAQADVWTCGTPVVNLEHGTDAGCLPRAATARPSAYRGVETVSHESAPDISLRLRRAAICCAVISAVLAGLALIGWALHVEILKRGVPGVPPMKANAAVCFLLASCALVLNLRSAPRRGARRAAGLCAGVVVLVASVTLVEYAFGVRLGIDQLLVHDRASATVPYPGRPAANAAVGLLLVGAAMLAWDWRLGRTWPSTVLGWAAAAVGLLALAGYVTGAESLISLSARQHIALNSTISLSVLSVGLLLARCDRGRMALLASRGQGGLVLRRLLPVAVGMPVVVAAGTLAGNRLGVLSTSVGGWVAMCATIVAMICLSWALARAAERAQRASDELARIVETTDEAILTVTPDGIIRSWNAGAQRLYGYAVQQAIGQPITILKEDEGPAGTRIGRALAGETVTFQTENRRADGCTVHVSVSLSPVRSPDGEITGVACLVRDVSKLVLHAQLESALREVTAAAASDMDERELATRVAARLGELLDTTTAAVIRADEDALCIVGYSGPAPYPERLGWDEASSSAQAVKTGEPARLEHYGPPSGAVGAFAAAQGLRCGISVPVRMHGGVWGCITVTTTRPSAFTAAQEQWLERFANLISAALANAQAQTLLREEARLERALREVALKIAEGEPDPDALFDLVAARVAALLEAPAAGVVRFDPEWLTVVGWAGPSLRPIRIARDEPSSSADVARTGKPAHISEYDPSAGKTSAFVASQGMASGLSTPIHIQGELWGCLSVTRNNATFTAQHEKWLERFANLTAAALANAQAQKNLRDRARLEEALRQIAAASASGQGDERTLAALVAERIADLLDAPSTSVVRFNGGGLTLLGSGGPAGLPLNEPIDERSASGRVARTGQVAVVNDYEQKPGSYQALARDVGGRSVIAVPVLVGGALWGSLGAMLHAEVVPRAAVELLERVAQLIASALANAQAQAKVREEARVERAMRRVAGAGAEGRLGERGLADLAAAEITELLDTPLAAVIRFDGPQRTTILSHAGQFAFPAALDPKDRSTVSAIVARTGHAARIDDYAAVEGEFATLATAHGIVGAIAVPIRVDGALWGCLGSMTYRSGGFPPGTEALLERVAEVVSVALANVRSRFALQHEAAVEQALREVSTASASGQSDATSLFGVVAARVAEVLNADAATVIRVDGETATPVGMHGIDRLPDTLPFHDGTATRTAWRTGRPARVDDYRERSTDADEQTSPLADGHRTAIAAPVRLHGRAWGCITAVNADPHSFQPGAESILERFAELVAVALAQADTLATLQRQATTDGLTGLLNHRTFQQRLHEEYDRSVRHGRPVALCVFDLDGFKAVNDTHGHAVGDRVLEAVAAAFTANRRSGDVQARIGGDEFAVIAPDTDAEGALALAERLRAAAASALSKLNVAVTLSAGVADLSEAATMHDLFHLADSALYWAKHHGRNQTVHYAPGVEHVISEELRRQHLERQQTLTGLTTLAHAVDAKKDSSRDHAERVADIAMQLALRLGWAPERCARLREAALLHDIGKISIPSELMDKTGPLSAEESELMKTHTVLGARIAQEVLDEEQVRWIRSHHERLDGSGYPDRLAAGDIPDGARLIRIADAYYAITTDSNHGRARSPQEALTAIRAHARSQFEPRLVDALEELASDTRFSNQAPGLVPASTDPARPGNGLAA